MRDDCSIAFLLLHFVLFFGNDDAIRRSERGIRWVDRTAIHVGIEGVFSYVD